MPITVLEFSRSPR